jgi:heavy metal efflux system protein
VPGAAFNFTQPIIDTSTEIATGSSADLAVIITGPDLETLRRLATETLALLASIPGAADTSIEQEPDQVQLRIDIDRAAVARYGLNVSHVQDTIELAIGGRPVSVLYEGERRFDITARLTADAREDQAAIGNIRIPTPGGGRVPLALLADIALVDGATIIGPAENQRQISVRTNIRGRDQGGFAAEAQRRFVREVTLPPGYGAEWGGQFQNLARARARMFVVVPLTVLIIFGLLVVTFRNTRDAALVLLCLPFAAVGGVLALWLRDINLSVSAFVGFVSLFGVTAMAGVLLVTEIGRHQRQHGLTHEQAVLAGARACMRPVLMMILVAMFGIVPAALATGIGSDIQRPLATVLLGGLCSALVLTLLAMTALYALFGSRMPHTSSSHVAE